MMTSYVSGWLFFGLLCVVFELMAPGLFYCLSFALATLPTALSAWYGCSLTEQSIVFFISSLVSFFMLYVCVRKAAQGEGHYKSNVDALPGKKGFVVEKMFRNHVGQVQVEGQIWSAQSVHQELLEKDTSIVVIRVEGVRLIVAAVTQS
jgi:membrane protein implicated in regulation of membrane protease activity